MSTQESSLLSGTFPVVPTPFLSDGEVDHESFENVVHYLIDAGVDGLVFPGLASEYAQLTEQERLKLTSIVGLLAKDKVHFVVGASAQTPEQAIAYSVAGVDAGAVCAMVMAPAQFAGDEVAMISFYKTLAQQAQAPIMLQNAPQPMGAGMPVDMVLRILEKVPQITYVKEETMPCGQRIEALLKGAPATLKGVFGGAGGRYIIDELNRGALGTVPASELTEVHIALVNAYRDGDEPRARQLFCDMLPILNMQAVYRCSLTKRVLLNRGLISHATVRVPGPQMDSEDEHDLRQFWNKVEDVMGALYVSQTASVGEIASVE